MVGDGMGGRSVAVKKGDLAGSVRGPGNRWRRGLATAKQTGPAAGVGPTGVTNLPAQAPANPVPPGVRASIVASKPVNAGGAKGRRKVEA